MKQIVVLAPSYYPARGGVEKHLHEVHAALKGRYRITVAVRYSAALPQRYEQDGVTVIRLPRGEAAWRLALWSLRHWRRLASADAFHSHDVFPGLIRRLFPRPRWIHTFHGYEGYPLNPAAIASRQAVKQRVDYCFGIGGFIEKWYQTPCDEVLYGATSLRASTPVPAIKWDVIFYGRFEEDTGFQAYLEGFKLLHDRQPNATMVALGKGRLQDWAEDFIVQHNLPVTLLEYATDVGQYLEQARVAFVSGYLTIAESMALGKPIVAVYETPIKHDYLTCHPQAGAMGIVQSPAEIAQTAEAALALKRDDPKLRAAQAWALEQTWPHIADRYARQYEIASR